MRSAVPLPVFLALGLLSAPLEGCSLSQAGMNTIHRRIERQGLLPARLEEPAAGLSVRYYAGGSGSPVLLLHGFGGDGPSTWQAQIPDFAEAHRVVVPDLLWFGESTSTTTPTLTAQAEAQLALLDHLSIDKVDVIGISYGGFVTLRLLQLAPERVGRVVIVDSPGPAFSDEDLQAMLERLGAETPGDIFLPDTPEDVQRLLDLTLFKERRLPRLVLRDMQRNLFSANRTEQAALLDDLPRNRALFSEADLQSLPETLVVWGRTDPVFPLRDGQELANMLGARLYVIDSADHGPIAEHPEEFNRVVLDFLASP